MGRFQLVVVAATVATYLVIVMGAVVRVTGSGLGCPDWPLCYGRLVPPLEATALIEYTHRLMVSVVSALVLAILGAAWLRWRHHRAVLVQATALAVLLAVQVIFGAVTVLTELAPWVVVVHLGLAILLLGLLVWLAVSTTPRLLAPTATARQPQVMDRLRRLARLAGITVAAVYALILTGATVRATGATWACVGFPECSGHLLPLGIDRLVDLHLLHRFSAYGVAILVLYSVVQAWPWRQQAPAIFWGAGALAIAVAVQATIGVVGVTTGFLATLQALHVAGAAAVWMAAVALAALAAHGPALLPADDDTQAATPAVSGSARSTAAAFIQLTKPRVTVLLLVPTLCAMIIAADGLPSPLLIGATLLGGALAAGAANAINCYLDRDIDALMGRTIHRSIPAGVISPTQALWFGLFLGAVSFALLTFFANLLAASLALAALLFYVFVYTRWLKRSSPSNIVIGGAAGAMPPLVGWAAVTGNLGLLPLYLFVIIVYWTPPHFWALSLLLKDDYARARIPMLPVVRGDAETRYQIVLYSLLLVAITLILFPFRLGGLFYLGTALLLGGVFLFYAWRLFREATALAARRLFRYSMLYLWLLLVGLVIDQTLLA